jgi:AcrR family transcriptional regulator
MLSTHGTPKEHDEATRARLLDAAERLSATHGGEALTVRRIAEEAGTSTRAVYALFAPRRGSSRRCTSHVHASARPSASVRRTDDPRRDIAVQSLAYRQWAVERPERYALAMHRFVGSTRGRAPTRAWPSSREALGELRQAVRRCADAGLLLGDRDPEDVVTHMRPWSTAWPSSRTSGCSARPRGPVAGAVAAQLDGYVQDRAAAA